MQDIYDKILEIVKSGENIEEFLTRESEWEYLYNLSSIRKNIIEWYDFDPEGSLLEIGGECGPITGLFCERLKKVVSIEASSAKSQINTERNKKYNNLEVITSDFENIDLDEKFDYITLIGSLERSNYYFKCKNAESKMIEKAKSFLKNDGTLIIALDNKYAIKYWAGTKDSHTGKLFNEITNSDNEEDLTAFSRDSLRKLIMSKGFKNIEFYYPVPDYKMPIEIYSENRMPQKDSISSISPSYDHDRYEVFDEVRVINELCKDGLFEQFANSFLVVCN